MPRVARRERERRRVIPRRVGGNAARSDRVVERLHRVRRAPVLERADALQVLAFQEHGGADPLVERCTIVMTGVRCTNGAIRVAAASTSAKVGPTPSFYLPRVDLPGFAQYAGGQRAFEVHVEREQHHEERDDPDDPRERVPPAAEDPPPRQPDDRRDGAPLVGRGRATSSSPSRPFAERVGFGDGVPVPRRGTARRRSAATTQSTTRSARTMKRCARRVLRVAGRERELGLVGRVLRRPRVWFGFTANGASLHAVGVRRRPRS